jgi:hypothetical protein
MYIHRYAYMPIHAHTGPNPENSMVQGQKQTCAWVCVCVCLQLLRHSDCCLERLLLISEFLRLH